ncbi:MAG TPA: CHAT domain-containing tetratricopeptide repeat protein [Streptosporangiaceae bacterium]|nr:CHAT domain-containing tetratricopeptide repeat protein [Streptosporangiaceae bacterium]
MTSGDPGAEDLAIDPAQLLPLTLSRPQDALVAARTVLAGQPGSYDASLAHQAIGIVLRDRGDLQGALVELRRAARLARASGRAEREVDVQATLGVTLAWTGRSTQGLAVLDQAVQMSHGGLAGRVLMRRAALLRDLGRFHEAHADLSRALPYLRRAGDTVWEARSLTWRGEVFLGLGLPGRAGADFTRAEELFATTGQELEYATARHNLGLAALTRGDLPLALTYFDEAGRRFEALGAFRLDLAMDRCAALLAAGLAADATGEADTALSRLPPGGGIAYRRAELLFTAATAALAAGDATTATKRARHARRLFRAQGRAVLEARADFVIAEARYAAGDRSTSLFHDVERVTARLEACRAGEAMRAHLLAGRLALSCGRAGAAEQHLERAARSRRRGPPLVRSVAWLARALQADARGDARATLGACARGLDALEEHQMTLGATELRAYGTAHGAELAALAQREALRHGDVRRLLSWAERWRATAVAFPGAPPLRDRELVAELSALRSVNRLLGTSELSVTRRASGLSDSRRHALERERRRLETAVQARTRQALGKRVREAGGLDLEALFDELGESSLIELVEVDHVLHVIIVADRRLRLHTVGSIPENEVRMTRFTLRRLAYGPLRTGDELTLTHRGTSLEAALLGPAAADLGDGPVVVIPPGRLQAVPWSLMPALRDRVVTVAPSTSTWMRARARKPPAQRRVALVVGPGLTTGGAEVLQLRSRYPEATVLGQGSATAENVLTALDGARLAHIAAHGTFRADNPLFSSLQLDDGPLTVHDLERLNRAPYRLVLSSCDSGVAATVGADELLGLVSSMVQLGAAGIVASVVPVNDLAAVPLMLALHDALRGGDTLPEALLAARKATRGDPLAEATAHSFIALGA